jgi:hypothetical protein
LARTNFLASVAATATAFSAVPVGTTTADSSGFSHTGTLQNGASWITTGLAPVPGGTTAAIHYDGTDDQVTAIGYKGVTGTASRSVSAWIRTTDTVTNQNREIISWGTNSGGLKWVFRIQNGNGTAGAIRLEVNGGCIVGSTVVTDGNWHHVAATLNDDGSPNVTEASLYVDGALETASAQLGEPINTSSGADVEIGGTLTAGRWKGDIDEVHIYSSVLTGAEVAGLAGIPEPSAFFLTSLGIVGLVMRRRRR